MKILTSKNVIKSDNFCAIDFGSAMAIIISRLPPQLVRAFPNSLMESCSTSTGISLVPNLPKHQPQAKQILKLPNIKGENKFTRIFCQSLYSRKYPEVFVPYFPCSVLNDDRFSLLKRDRFFHVYMWRSFGGIIISPPRASCPKCTCNPRLTIITRRSFGEMAPGSSTG